MHLERFAQERARLARLVFTLQRQRFEMKRRMFWRRCQKRRKRAFIKYFPPHSLRRQGVAVNAGSGFHVQALVSHDIELFLSAIQITGKTEELEQENAGRHVGRSGFHVLG